MQIARSTLVWLWVIAWGTLVAAVGLVVFVVFNPWLDPRRRAMEQVSAAWATGIFKVCQHYPIATEGLERLKGASEPYIICPNHESLVDILVMLAVFPNFKFIAKPPLFWLPPIALQMRLSGYIQAAKGEEGGADRVMEQALHWLAQGCHVLVFPEGTRSPNERMLRFRQGAFHIAQKAGVKVVPVAITGSRQMLAKNAFHIDPAARITVRVLEPIEPSGTPKEVAALTRARILAALNRREAA